MSKKLTTEEFIAKAKIAHGNNKYDYSKVNYVNSITKVTIICPAHGEFEQRPSDHLSKYGCSKCGGSHKPTTDEFIEKAKLVHKDRYDYSEADYINAHTKIKIICAIHGAFEQKAHDHLNGHGCSCCRYDSFNISLEEFNERAKQAHNNTYDYSKVLFKSVEQKVIIRCLIHGEFEQSVHSHLRGQGCPGCARHGFNPNSPAYLYYLKITTEDNQTLYKIGITNKTVNERFGLIDLSKIEIVKQKLYDIGQDAYDWEQKLLKMYKQYQYKGPNVLESGNTELFTEDIIAMYYAENLIT